MAETTFTYTYVGRAVVVLLDEGVRLVPGRTYTFDHTVRNPELVAVAPPAPTVPRKPATPKPRRARARKTTTHTETTS